MGRGGADPKKKGQSLQRHNKTLTPRRWEERLRSKYGYDVGKVRRALVHQKLNRQSRDIQIKNNMRKLKRTKGKRWKTLMN